MYQGTLPATTNRQTWTDGFALIDPDTNGFLDLTGATLTMKVARKMGESALLTGTNTDGDLTVPDTGRIVFRFSAERMSTLCPGTYAVVLRFERDGDTTDLFVGYLPVLESIQ